MFVLRLKSTLSSVLIQPENCGMTLLEVFSAIITVKQPTEVSHKKGATQPVPLVMTIMQPRWLGVISTMITMPLEFPRSPQCILHHLHVHSPGKSALVFILLHCSIFLFAPFVLYHEGRRWLIIGIIMLTVFFIIHKSTQSLSTPWISQRLWLPPSFICWGLRCTACPPSAP